MSAITMDTDLTVAAQPAAAAVSREAPFLSVFPVEATTESEAAFVIRLGIRHADCLAQDRCGVPPTNFQALTFKPISRKP